MKKIFSLLLILALMLTSAFAMTGCGEGDENATVEQEPENVTVYALKGPSAIGMAPMIDGNEQVSEGYRVEYLVADSPDTITGKIINGEVQIAALPTNVASVLYNKTEGGVQFLALNTLGVLYLVGTEDIASLEDLKGKTIVSSGSGGVPEYAVDYILQQDDLRDSVTIEYTTDHATAAQLLLGGDYSLAILPQPFVAQVTQKDAKQKILLDLTEEWDRAAGGESVLSMGCLAVSSEFATDHPKFIKGFLEKYEASVAFVNENPEAAAQLVAENGILQNQDVVAAAIPYCNIVFETAQDAKEQINGFLSVLHEMNPASVGGTLPDDAFYYGN